MPRLPISTVLAIGLTACGSEATGSLPAAADAPARENAVPRIKITASGGTIIARLEDNPTSRDLLKALPLTLALRDHEATEKVAILPRPLSTEGAAGGADPEIYDVAYYAPYRTFVMYYRDFGYSAGLVPLGHIEAGADRLSSLAGTVTIEAVAQ